MPNTCLASPPRQLKSAAGANRLHYSSDERALYQLMRPATCKSRGSQPEAMLETVQKAELDPLFTVQLGVPYSAWLATFVISASSASFHSR